MKRKTQIMLATIILAAIGATAQIDLSKTIPDIQYESQYHFTAGIDMEIDFYDRKGKLDNTIPYYSYYSDDFNHIAIRHIRGRTIYQTIFDRVNHNCLILLGEEGNLTGSAAVMKSNEGREIKVLELTNTGATKLIAGYPSVCYTFDVKEFSGEMWITDALELPNDVGLFKASKTGKYYQALSVEGFVLEITSITPKGKKTVMKTTAIHPSQSMLIEIPEPFGRSINRIDYYAY